MDPMVLFITILIGLLLILLMPTLLPFMRTSLAAALSSIAGAMRRIFGWAGRLVTDDGELSPSHALAQVAGATLMLAAGVVYTLCDLQFTLATLAPLFGFTFNGEMFAGFDQLLGLSLVLLAVTFGLIITDLLGWTFVTKFARIERARLGALCVAVLCFVMSLAVTVALSLRRLEAMMADGTNIPVEEAVAGFGSLPAFILLPLAALLFIGTAFTFMSLETFTSAIVALLLAMGGVALGAVWIILGTIHFLAGVATEAAETIRQSTAPIAQSFQSGLRSVGVGISKGSGALFTKLNNLVRPAAAKKPAVPAAANGLNSPESPARDLGVLATANPQAEEREQRPNPNGRDLAA